MSSTTDKEQLDTITVTFRKIGEFSSGPDGHNFIVQQSPIGIKWLLNSSDNYLCTEYTGKEDGNHKLYSKRPHDQIDKLARFIMEHIDGEPAQDEGTGDYAIRIIKNLQEMSTASQA